MTTPLSSLTLRLHHHKPSVAFLFLHYLHKTHHHHTSDDHTHSENKNLFSPFQRLFSQNSDSKFEDFLLCTLKVCMCTLKVCTCTLKVCMCTLKVCTCTLKVCMCTLKVCTCTLKCCIQTLQTSFEMQLVWNEYLFLLDTCVPCGESEKGKLHLCTFIYIYGVH